MQVWFLNPNGVDLRTYAFLFLCMRGFLFLVDSGVKKASSFLFPPLPTLQEKKEGREDPCLEGRDFLFLLLNSIIEFVFFQHVLRFLFSYSSLSSEALLLSPLCLWLLFVLDDLLYTPLHMLLHRKEVYSLIHKHHHKSKVPSRGYVDAGNEHPAEQILALLLHFSCLSLLLPLFLGGHEKIHPLPVLLHLLLKAVGSVLNHTQMDVSFCLLGLQYSVLHHSIHHRKQVFNYGQLTMIWDHFLFSTFLPS